MRINRITQFAPLEIIIQNEKDFKVIHRALEVLLRNDFQLENGITKDQVIGIIEELDRQEGK